MLRNNHEFSLKTLSPRKSWRIKSSNGILSTIASKSFILNLFSPQTEKSFKISFDIRRKKTKV